jgi:hypothetical protein
VIALPATAAALLIAVMVLLPRSVREGVSAIGSVGLEAPQPVVAADDALDPPRPADEVGARDGRSRARQGPDPPQSGAGMVAPSTEGESLGGDDNVAEPSTSPAGPSGSSGMLEDASSSGGHGPPEGKGPPVDPGPPANPGPPAHAGPPR